MIVEKSAPDWIGAVAFPWLSRLIAHASSYRALSHHVLRVVLSCQFVHLLATFFGPSCVNFWIATRFLDLETINHRCALLLHLFQSFFGLDRVLSNLLIDHADLACLRLCELHTKRLSERRTSPFSLRASSAKKRSNTTIASINFFIQRNYWILWEIWHKSKTFENFTECE